MLVVTMSEAPLQSAVQELKRADHSITVSLKYTRTVDVIKSIIDRLINTIDFCLEALLEHAKEEGNLSEVPKLPRLKAEKAKELFKDDSIIPDFCDFFLLLRRISKASFDRAQEFRRHVTMTAYLDTGDSVEVTIDIISDYFERTREFFNHVSRLVNSSE
ncbi:hypothetical protein COV18_01445 [Candidatus Woesearchaeota archaeon CG10_big_fil_rev_8_21_14_0_10_37_12]|nr:MAG: hypothetical protein COV18_01445 [Candidatus Woesearchaeota archaeon CG10_big_fil_rev_8_21_14_0_10_37_12]